MRQPAAAAQGACAALYGKRLQAACQTWHLHRIPSSAPSLQSLCTASSAWSAHIMHPSEMLSQINVTLLIDCCCSVMMRAMDVLAAAAQMRMHLSSLC